jgi:hypothetical protein
VKLLIYSDLHLEHQMFEPDPQTVRSADVVVLAGDIYPGARGAHLIRRMFPDSFIIWVPGNHEFYGGHWLRTLEVIHRAAISHDIQLLDDDELLVGGIRILGTTLWTDFDYFGAELRQRAMGASKECIADYHSIRHGLAQTEQFEKRSSIDVSPSGLLEPEHTLQKHYISRQWLEQALALGERERTVVITHHFPHANSCAPIYRSDLLTAAFGSRLPEKLITQCKLWVHGHTHTSFDYRVNHGGDSTRVICNPRGYPLSGGRIENPEFDPGLLVEV